MTRSKYLTQSQRQWNQETQPTTSYTQKGPVTLAVQGAKGGSMGGMVGTTVEEGQHWWWEWS